MKEFVDPKEAVNYAEDNWKQYFESLSEDNRMQILSMESSGKTMLNPYHRDIFKVLEKVVKVIPPFPEDLVLYRGGSENDFSDERPFLASSFIKSVAETFANKKGNQLYKIYVFRGEKAVPICGMGIPGCSPEQEVVLETRKIHRNGTDCYYYEDSGFYKLFKLEDEKLYSAFGRKKPVLIGEEYSAEDDNYKLCFGNLSGILNYRYEHGDIICDVIPRDKVIEGKTFCSGQEGECNSIIVVNPRSIYSPSFIREILENVVARDVLTDVTDDSFVRNIITHSDVGKCYGMPLSYDLSEVLLLMLFRDYKEINKVADFCFEYHRPRYNYYELYKLAKKHHADTHAKAIIIQAWNKYSKCKRSRLLNIIYCLIPHAKWKNG